MNKDKRKDILRILKSGWSSTNISSQIGNILNQPEDDIFRIIKNLKWNQKHILSAFEYFPESKTEYTRLSNE